jgi:hypothetical protein
MPPVGAFESDFGGTVAAVRPDDTRAVVGTGTRVVAELTGVDGSTPPAGGAVVDTDADDPSAPLVVVVVAA